MTSFDFYTDVIERSYNLPVVVQFSAPSCGPCLFMEKQMVALTRRLGGKIEYVSLPLEKYPHLADEFAIKSNPTIILFIKGTPRSTLKGAIPDYAVEQWINDHL